MTRTTMLETLKERGFVEAITEEDKLAAALEKPITCYVGYDPTATSLHAGNLVTIMALAHMQRAGHRVVVLIGGGTGMIGDPSGKTEMRKVLGREEIDANAAAIKKQFQPFLTLDGKAGVMVNNADWLLPIGYLEFLRDVGRHFSVNRMLAAEAYRTRYDSGEGLNFIEFNYMLLQAYDFLHLFRAEKCLLQMGGSDQWGNIIAGTDLIRRVTGGEAYGITFPLIMTSAGVKMGKTAAGAIWLDAQRLKPYDYYQFWVNTADADVGRFLSLFTFLPIDEVRRLAALQGAEIREAKKVLAWEATKLCHGEKAADEARSAALALFSPGAPAGAALENVPTTEIPRARLAEGLRLVDVLAEVGLASSKSDARRKVEQGGAYVNDAAADSIERALTEADFPGGQCLLRSGKKKYHRLQLR